MSAFIAKFCHLQNLTLKQKPKIRAVAFINWTNVQKKKKALNTFPLIFQM